jgi:Tfp pilus assembly protein PilF
MTSDGAAGRFDDGLLLFEKGDYYGAEAAFRAAVGLGENSAEAYLYLGWTLLNLDKNLEAGAAFQAALRLNPAAASAHEGLGLVLSNEQRYPAAEAAFRAAVRLDPDSGLTWWRLAESLYSQGRYLEADVAFRDAIRADPGLVAAPEGLGWASPELEDNAAEQDALGRTAPSSEVLLGSPRAAPWRRFCAGVVDLGLIPGCCGLFLGGFGWWGVPMGIAIYALNGYIEGVTGQSYGKMLTGLHTISGTTGKYLGGGKGVLRRFLLVTDYGTMVTFVIGLLWGQTIADAIMDTVVVWRPWVNAKTKHGLAPKYPVSRGRR